MSINAKLEKAVKSVERCGADFSDIYFETSSSHSLAYEDSRFEEISSSISEGVGARVVKGDETSLFHAPGMDLSTGIFCLGQAAGNCGIPCSLDQAGDIRIMEREPSLTPPDTSFFHHVDTRIRNASIWVRQVAMNLETCLRAFTVLNTQGVLAGDRRIHTVFSVEVVVEKGKLLQTGYECSAFALGSGDFFRKVSPLETAGKALARALLMLDAPECPSGPMDVLLAGEAGGTMIHEACGHGLEADIVQKDYSVYRGKIGRRVASPLVTMVDDGTLPGFLGSGGCDDEGTPCRRNVLIHEGVLQGYMNDVTTSVRDASPLSGNGRRSSYRAIPQPRMTNTFVEPGTSSTGDMLRKISKGLLVKKMGGGEVDPTSGDFVFHVTEGYLVKDGKILHPVRGAILTGNGPEVLMNIEAVGNELCFQPGICGKSGQNVPVTDGQPSLLIRNLVVGGSGDSDGPVR